MSFCIRNYRRVLRNDVCELARPPRERIATRLSRASD